MDLHNNKPSSEALRYTTVHVINMDKHSNAQHSMFGFGAGLTLRIVASTAAAAAAPAPASASMPIPPAPVPRYNALVTTRCALQ